MDGYSQGISVLELLMLLCPFAALVATGVLFPVLGRHDEGKRWKIIAALGGAVVVLEPVLSWLYSESFGSFLVSKQGVHTFWALLLVPIDLLIFERLRKLPAAHAVPIFAAVAVVTLSPFMFEGLPANFGAVFLASLLKGYVDAIPSWFMRVWWINSLSFLLTGALSYFLGRKHLSR